jgi:hypothetical protein
MAAGSTYFPIATTVGAGTSSVSFTSIPSTYTDLVLVASPVVSSAGNWHIRFNGDTGTNYSWTILTGDGSTASSVRYTNTGYMRLGYQGYPATTAEEMLVFNLMNYANTTTNKTAVYRSSKASGGVDAIVGLWRSTAAINQLTITSESGTFNSSSTFTLYGISAA